MGEWGIEENEEVEEVEEDEEMDYSVGVSISLGQKVIKPIQYFWLFGFLA